MRESNDSIMVWGEEDDGNEGIDQNEAKTQIRIVKIEK